MRVPDYVICTDCGEYLEGSDQVFLYNGARLCAECFANTVDCDEDEAETCAAENGVDVITADGLLEDDRNDRFDWAYRSYCEENMLAACGY